MRPWLVGLERVQGAVKHPLRCIALPLSPALCKVCSGMLPGYVSGFYSYDDCHIDLERLARFANARLIHAEARGIDLQVGKHHGMACALSFLLLRGHEGRKAARSRGPTMTDNFNASCQ